MISLSGHLQHGNYHEAVLFSAMFTATSQVGRSFSSLHEGKCVTILPALPESFSGIKTMTSNLEMFMTYVIKFLCCESAAFNVP